MQRITFIMFILAVILTGTITAALALGQGDGRETILYQQRDGLLSEVMLMDVTRRVPVTLIRDIDRLAVAPEAAALAYTARRDDGYHCYYRPLDGDAQRISQRPARDCTFAWSYDGSDVAFVTRADDGWLLTVAEDINGLIDGTTRREWPFPDAIQEWGVEWSPDGRYLLLFTRDVLYGWSLRLLNVETGEFGFARGVFGLSNDYSSVDFSAQWSRGRYLGFTGFRPASGRILIILDTETGTTRVHQANTFVFGDNLWSPGGRYYAFAMDGILSIWDVTTDEAALTFPMTGRWHIDWSPDDRYFTLAHDNGLTLHDVQSGEPEQLTHHLTRSHWSPDGRYALYRDSPVSVRLLERAGTDTQIASGNGGATVAEPGVDVVFWTANGLLYTNGDDFAYYDLDTEESRTIPGMQQVTRVLRLTDYALIETFGYGVYLIRLDNLQVTPVDTPVNRVGNLDWSGSGRYYLGAFSGRLYLLDTDTATIRLLASGVSHAGWLYDGGR